MWKFITHPWNLRKNITPLKLEKYVHEIILILRSIFTQSNDFSEKFYDLALIMRLIYANFVKLLESNRLRHRFVQIAVSDEKAKYLRLRIFANHTWIGAMSCLFWNQKLPKLRKLYQLILAFSRILFFSQYMTTYSNENDSPWSLLVCNRWWWLLVFAIFQGLDNNYIHEHLNVQYTFYAYAILYSDEFNKI